MAIISFTTQILAGKTLGRYLFNKELARQVRGFTGTALDLAGNRSYLEYMPATLTVRQTNISTELDMERVNFNEQLPFPDSSFDYIFLFNALYIVREPERLMRDIRRLLRPNGRALVASPFLQNEMREPHDYCRLTSEGLTNLFISAGFSSQKLISYGERFSVAVNLLHSFWYFSFVRLVIYALACALDKVIPPRVKARYPAPLGYFCVLQK